MELQLQRGARKGISPPISANEQAPSFDSIPQFDKKTKGLFPVHVHVSEKGLIFVNLSADQNVTPFEVQPFIESLI